MAKQPDNSRKPNKKEQRSARRSAAQEASARAKKLEQEREQESRYNPKDEVWEDVGGPRPHRQRYHKNKEDFEAGATAGGQQDMPRSSQAKAAGQKAVGPDPYAGADQGGSTKRPKNAPAPSPKIKASASLGSGSRPPGGTTRYTSLHGNPRNPQHMLEQVAIEAAKVDKQLQSSIPDPRERAQIAAGWAIDKIQASNKNINLEKIDTGTVADMISEPRISNLTSKEQELAYPKKKSQVAKSLEAREQGVRDTFRPKSSAKAGASTAPPSRERERRRLGIPVQGEAKPRKGSKGQDTGGLDSKGRGVGVPTTETPPGPPIKGTTSKAKVLKEGDPIQKGKLSNQKFLQSLSPEEQGWVQQQMEYGGEFYGAKGNKVPGAYRKWQRYSNARQAGAEAPISKTGSTDTNHPTYKWLTADRRGRSNVTNTDRPQKTETDKMIKDRTTGGVTRKRGTKPRDRYKSGAPSHEDFGVGIRVPGIPSTAQLKQQFPDLSDREVFEMQESAKQSVEEFMQNQRMAHETRQATILGRSKSESGAGSDDRVVFLTTSTGHPSVSVGANSLLGQYIIKKRKAMMYNQRMAGRAQLKGEFPYAVRDQHVVEAATGITVGAQGRYGAFKQIGYRVGAKKSKGYGKTLPVGAQILRDSSGQPLYDRNGNLRYTEGFTRPFDLRPSNEVGLRIYLG